MNARRTLGFALLSVLALSGAACGGGDDNAAGTTTTTEEATTSTTEEATTTTTESEETTTTADIEAEDNGNLEEFATSLLLTGDDLSFDQFEDDGGFSADDDGEGPCGNPTTGEDADADVGTSLTNSANTLNLTEEIQVYADASTAADVFQTGIEGVDCTESADGRFQIGEPSDVTDQIDGADQAVAFPVTGDGFQGVVVGVLFVDSIVTFTFVASPPSAADDPSVPDPVSVAAFGIQKISDAVN